MTASVFFKFREARITAKKQGTAVRKHCYLFVTKSDHFVTKNDHFGTKSDHFVTENDHFVTENDHFVTKSDHFVIEKTIFHFTPQNVNFVKKQWCLEDKNVYKST
jgi:hypothetical protein